MFQKNQLDGLYEELNRDFCVDPDYERILREAHLGIALVDAGKTLHPEIDTRVANLLQKYGHSA